MNSKKEVIMKNLNGIFCGISVIALLLPLASVGAKSSVKGASGESSQAVSGIKFITESGFWGILFIVAIVAILLFTYLKQLAAYKKIICIAAPVLMILALFVGVSAASAASTGAGAGAGSSASKVEVDVSFTIGFWIELICSVCILGIGVISFFNLRGNAIFDAVSESDNGDEVVKDLCGPAHGRPGFLVTAGSVQEVEDGIFLLGVGLIAVGSVDG